MRPLSIELAFDEGSDRRLRQLWSRLEIHDRSTNSELGLAPHIILAVFRRGEPKSVLELVKRFAVEVAPFVVRLERVDRFPTGEGVVEPAPSPDLARAHALLHRRLGADGEQVDPYYRPEVWQPHCTMAIHVPESKVDTVIAACRSSDAFGEVSVERMQVVRYRPATELARFELGRRD